VSLNAQIAHRALYAVELDCLGEKSVRSRSGTKRNCLGARGISGAEGRPAVTISLATTAACGSASQALRELEINLPVAEFLETHFADRERPLRRRRARR